MKTIEEFEAKYWDLDITEFCKEVFEMIPHSETRVPYTYHHDSLRPLTTKLGEQLLSRGDIAFLTRGSSDAERYATALLYVLETLDAKSLLTIPHEYAKILVDLHVFFDDYVGRVKANI